jgi:hypothetical protein
MRDLPQGHRPIQSIKMASIPGPAVEDLEARLKKDVLAEASACGGRILVHREAGSATQSSGALSSLGLSEDTHAAPVIQPYWCVRCDSPCVARTLMHFPLAGKPSTPTRCSRPTSFASSCRCAPATLRALRLSR